MKKVIYLIAACAIILPAFGFAQNVGIGTSAPLEKLHVIGNVRVSNLAGVGTRLVGSNNVGTLVNIAAGTNGQVLTQTAGGPAWTSSPAWLVGGNTLAATGNFGTISNNHIDLISNNIVRGRISNLGEFFIGTTNTVITGDLMNGVSNVAFPWAVNGYSAQNGSGVYGQITGGSTIYAGVQGEYNGTSARGAGVRGISLVNVGGTSFSQPHTGVSGDVANVSGSYKFGTYGSGGFSTRSGGVMGNDYGVAYGALGYYASNGADYSVYGFGQGHTTGGAGGRMSGSQSLDEPNTNIGLGIYGGVMGGWVRGMVYGMHVKGERTSLYVDGNTVTNKPITQLVTKDNGDRVGTFVPSSTSADVMTKGKAKLASGQTYVSFTEDFRQMIGNPSDLVITVTPTGNSNGVYVSSVDANGFWVKENNGGSSNVELSWIATGIRNDFDGMELSSEILKADFDSDMESVMNNEMDESEKKSLWWDGSEVRHDAPPARTPGDMNKELQRDKGITSK